MHSLKVELIVDFSAKSSLHQQLHEFN